MARISQKAQDRQQDWINKIDRAKRVRKNWRERFKVQVARDYFDGIQNPGYPEKEWITINKVYSHLKATLPSLYNADPYFYVKLKRSFNPNPMLIALWEKRGRIRQSYLNYLKEETKLKEKARLCIQDAHFAYGVMMVHYMADWQENEDFGKPLESENGNPMYDDEGSPLMEPQYIPINERYKVTRIHPDDFLWDEDAGPLDDSWSWHGREVRRRFGDLKNDPRFSKTAINQLRGKDESKDDERKAREERKKGTDVKGPTEQGTPNKRKVVDDEKIIVYWEIYNLKTGNWSVIAEEGVIPLIDDEPQPKGIEKTCFCILRFTLRDDSPYPIPPVSQGMDVCKEYNIARSQVLVHRKRFNRKYEVVDQAIEEDDLPKLEAGEDGTLVRVKMLNAVQPIKDAPLDQQRYLEIGFLNQDIIELLGGATDESRGIAGADTATQAGILDKRLEIKEGDAMSMVIDFVKEIARKLDQLVQTHISRDEAVRITGPQGEFWELVKSDDYEEIDGEFEYGVNVGATIPRLPQMERNSWMAFLTLLSNFPHLLAQRHLLKRMAEMHHIEDEPMLEELYQLGQQIMGGQVPLPGKTGSQPGVGESRPVSAIGGQMAQGGGLGV